MIRLSLTLLKAVLSHDRNRFNAANSATSVFIGTTLVTYIEIRRELKTNAATGLSVIRTEVRSCLTPRAKLLLLRSKKNSEYMWPHASQSDHPYKI